MKPEDYSACESAIFYYENPWFATADKVKKLYDEYNVSLYTTMTFTFIHCIEPPAYMMPAENYENVLHLCGGKYLFEFFPNYENHPNDILDANTSPYTDGRQYYSGNGRVLDLFDGEYREEVKGIIIGPVQDFYDKHSIKCGGGTMTIGDTTFEVDEMSFVPKTDFTDLCTVTEDRYSVRRFNE